MRRLSIILSLSAFLASCNGYSLKEEQRPYKVKAQPKEFFSILVNGDDPASDITLTNPDYPISIKLFEDGRFFYTLPTLKDGTGWGQWKHEDGRLSLYAERLLFTMKMDIRNIEGEGEGIAIEFADRNASRFLRLIEEKQKR